MNGLSLWGSTAKQAFADPLSPVLASKEFHGHQINVQIIKDSLWVVVNHFKGHRTAIRTAFSPNVDLSVNRLEEKGNLIRISLQSIIGKYSVRIELPDIESAIIRCTTTFTAHQPLYIPFWPRDLLLSGKKSGAVEGKIHASQVQTRSGLIYLSTHKPHDSSFMYFQNLSALGDYCQETETSLAETVGGTWPELGFALPPTKEKPIPPNKQFIISDAFIAFSDDVPEGPLPMARQFLDLLASVYLHLPRPETIAHNYPDILEKSLQDLHTCHGCWMHVNGHSYLNAYLCDYKTPPEVMVQLAVLLPLVEYRDWSEKDLPLINQMTDALPAFYDEKIKTIARWMPATEDKLDRSEEQKKPRVMDSWYLYHPMLQLSKLALKGDDTAKKLFLDSLDYSVRIARHFNYRWPVFYDVDTLEVIKKETEPGKGGEKDVAGLYAHVMLQAWDLTKEKRYLDEAEKAARSLTDYGLDIFYQANNTAFAATAMLRLWKETKKQLYLDLSYLLMASIFKNTHIWSCNYGHARNYPTFFALYPLNDAPYTAIYEEQEVFASLHDYLVCAEDENILPSLSLLITEYIRYAIFRAVYYYPPMLPKDMLSEHVKTGEVDPSVWIALEDLHDGWEKSGEVGQEVYGAGLAFGVVPRHYLRIPGEDFMVFSDYPVSGFTAKKGKTISFAVQGNSGLECRLVIVKGKSKLPDFEVSATGHEKPLSGKRTRNGNLEFTLRGGQTVKIHWTKPKTR